MRRHLTDREMTAHALGLLEKEALAHLAECRGCRTEYARLRTAIMDLAVQTHGQATRSEAFFHAQRMKIGRRLGEHRRRSEHRWIVWAPALAAAALLVVFVARGRPPLPDPRTSETDQSFLTAVEYSIYTEVPGALRPVTLLITEVEQGMPHVDGRITPPRGDQL